MPKKTVQQMMLRRAKRKYDNMLTCVEALVSTLPLAEKEIRRMNPRVKGRSYRLASQDDLLKLVAGVRDKLIGFAEDCKKHETKLTTQDWTV
ncbi:hypothetical protein [Kutzneria kofuensis]|uniref:Uncharacterized protein n=1 Tax=Kutzneria kofuensis TaxID=103725 RepID=A0A7W9KDV0_9PSEU|nr:hypothetical protein [Kutzneria kofuensis]MBB5890667.1 hypothetical protein [Kutzneria kofuensis]